MQTILRRTTALAILAALPLAAAAVPAGADVIRKPNGEYVQRTAEATAPAAQAAEIAQSATGTAPAATGETAPAATGETAQTTTGETPQTATGATAQSAATSGQPAEGTAAQASDPASGAATAQAPQDTAGTDQPAQPGSAAVSGEEPDMLVARVGEADIMRSDVLGVIGQLPPQLQQQPPEMLIPMALDQLVLRELILQEARGAGLDKDADVKAKEGDGSDLARENAMVQVWLDRALADAVTEERVSDTYDTIRAEMGDQTPPLDAVRPQIEHELRRQAFAELAGELHTDGDVTLFGPDGQPMTR